MKLGYFLYIIIILNTTIKADEISFVSYNDYFTGSDQHFTNGVALSWMDGNEKDYSYTKFILQCTKNIFINLDTNKNYNAGITLKQFIVTPEDTTVETPQYNDLPYAGYLALSTYLLEWNEDSFYEYALEVGVIGKESLAGSVQTLFHTLIGNDKPKGWDTQLGTQYIANIFLQYGTISYENEIANGFHIDWFHHIGVNLGNFNTSAIAGTALRIGKNYVQNFNVHYPFLQEEASLIKLNKKIPDFAWAVSIGVDAKALYYSYILDEAEQNGYDIRKNNFDYSFFLSNELYFSKHKISLLYQSQSPYTKENHKVEVIGALIYTYQF